MAKADDGRVIKDEGRTNGQIVSSQSSQSLTSSRRRTMPRKTWTAWLFTTVARLTMWYTIITVLFRCPSDSTSLASDNPRICRPWLTTRSYIDPYVGPYYETYASPYVDKAKPYVNSANVRVIKPATVLAIDNYNRYAAPQVAKARGYTLAQWEKNGLPQLKKVQESAQEAYDGSLAPHVQKASKAATPYYETAKDNAFNVHKRHIIPAIAYSQPHFQSAYATVQRFALEKLVPSVQFAWTNTIIFVDGTLWPFIRKVYGDNVRPQLVMIGERIAKYQEGRKLQSAMDEVGASETTSSIDQAASENHSSTTETTTTSTATTESTSSTSATAAPRVATDETVTEDLVKWQKKFAVAADKGTDDLRERIEDIIHSMVKRDLGEGEGLANALEKTAEVELGSFKAKINAVASTLAKNAPTTDVSAAETEVMQAVRAAAQQIKDRARNVRAWADTFKQDLKQRTELATDSTLHVLDDIRDLGLQEIGMRWAWMEGITYKHWQKYHDLKRKFADWRSEVREVALSNPAMTEAHEKADKILEESMSVTENAAKELIRLRDVARWKIAARDSTDDFDTRAIPVVASAASAASAMADDIKDAIVGTPQGTVESLSSVASEQVVGASKSAMSLDTTGTAESLASDALSTGTSFASQVSAAADDLASSASSAVVGTSTGSVESFTDAASSATDSATSFAASATIGPSGGVLSSGSSFADSISSSASSAIVSASASRKLQDAVNAAGDKATDLTSSLSAI